MSTRTGAVHVATTKRVYKGKTYTTHLLRRSVREGGKVKHQTLGNISHLPPETIDLVRRSLGGETFIPASANSAVRITRSLPYGHVRAVLAMIHKLDLPSLIASKPSRKRALILAMVAQRVLSPGSKLEHTRCWLDTTLANQLGVADADVAELYHAMDWLLPRKAALESKLARKHLVDGGLVLYDVSSSFYYGEHCPLVQFGYNRDGKTGCGIIVYGLLTDGQGRPVAVDIFPGNTSDPNTVPAQVTKLTQRFKVSRAVLVGDRGMLTQTQIDHIKKYPQLGWISALRSRSISKLLAKKLVARKQIEQETLAEITSPDFPKERLVVCFNPDLAKKRLVTREKLLGLTEKKLQELADAVAKMKDPPGKGSVGIRAGKVVNKYKMAKHFRLEIESNQLKFERKTESIEAEKQLDGIYVVRTSEPKERLSAADTVRLYKRLSQVEQAFRSLKGLGLMLRPIHHRLEERVKSHILICLLSYYVEWHLRKAWAPLLFQEENLERTKQEREPMRPASPTTKARKKKSTKQTTSELPVHSLKTLMEHLGTLCLNYCEVGESESRVCFERQSEPTPTQVEAFRLIEA